MFSDTLIRALPKTDLHVHLDGSLRPQTLIDLASERAVALPSATVEGLDALVFKSHYADLGEYLQGFAYTCAVLQDPEALERTAYELAWDNLDEGVRYVEVRFAPQLHMHEGFGFDEVILAVHRGLARAAKEFNARAEVLAGDDLPFHAGIVVCALRMFTPSFSRWYAQLCAVLADAPSRDVYSVASLELARAAVRCRDERGVPIVGFDLAGQEDGYPAGHHHSAYAYSRRNFLNATVHAGEAYGPESIYEAITELHADRIGHGYTLFQPELCGPEVRDPQRYVRELAEYIADRRITIEVCITSNLQTNPRIARPEQHVFGKMLQDRLSASLCTDNRLVSHTTVSREYRLAIDAFKMDRKQLRSTVINGFKRSFFPGSYRDKRAYVRRVIDRIDRVFAASGE